MTDRTYRVIVRGTFAGLDAARKAELLAEADQHDLYSTAFTEEGTLAYDRALHAFSLRFEVRQGSEASDDDAIATGCLLAEELLDRLRITHGPLRGTATSVDDMKINRPKRR
ncbi:DUF6204 family protein [Hamadaea tsunoensis]|uniref:DUF6204 family protein n=1 Tax=Hamadaea tsunoensis TaxID=53368 RepID=UPI0003FFA3F1|nr:DUF6204 family protein [Hamadaea tsunoensis]